MVKPLERRFPKQAAALGRLVIDGVRRSPAMSCLVAVHRGSIHRGSVHRELTHGGLTVGIVKNGGLQDVRREDDSQCAKQQ